MSVVRHTDLLTSVYVLQSTWTIQAYFPGYPLPSPGIERDEQDNVPIKYQWTFVSRGRGQQIIIIGRLND